MFCLSDKYKSKSFSDNKRQLSLIDSINNEQRQNICNTAYLKPNFFFDIYLF